MHNNVEVFSADELYAQKGLKWSTVCYELGHIIFFFLIMYLFMTDRERERERGRDTGRGRSRPNAESPMWDSIPGLQDHSLGHRQELNP